MEGALNGKRLVQETPVEGLFGLVDHYYGFAQTVELRAASTTDHLQHVGDGHINVTLGLSIKKFSAFDNDKMGG